MMALFEEIGSFISTISGSLVAQCIGFLSFVLLVLQVLNEAIALFSPIEANFLSHKYFTWRKVEKFIEKLAKKINDDHTTYGMIVATGRGGGILAALLSYKLDLTPVLVFDRQFGQDKQGSKNIVCIESKIEVDDRFDDLLDKPILLITSRSDPGLTLDKYIDVLRASGFTGRIDKCAILASKKTIDELKYCLEWYTPNTKVKGFPWEKKSPDLMERIVNFKN